MPDVNSSAPDFTLFHAKGETITLSELRGKKVVLLFLPGAFTGVCTKEVCAVQEDLNAYSDLGAEVIGIAADGLFAILGFRAANDISFPIVSDFALAATKAYGTAWPDFAGIPGYTVSNRAVFVVNEQGNIAYKWVGENPGAFPPFDEVKAALA